MIELGFLGTKTSFDIAEAFALSELSKGQTKELIPTGVMRLRRTARGMKIGST